MLLLCIAYIQYSRYCVSWDFLTFCLVTTFIPFPFFPFSCSMQSKPTPDMVVVLGTSTMYLSWPWYVKLWLCSHDDYDYWVVRLRKSSLMQYKWVTTLYLMAHVWKKEEMFIPCTLLPYCYNDIIRCIYI